MKKIILIAISLFMFVAVDAQSIQRPDSLYRKNHRDSIDSRVRTSPPDTSMHSRNGMHRDSSKMRVHPGSNRDSTRIDDRNPKQPKN